MWLLRASVVVSGGGSGDLLIGVHSVWSFLQLPPQPRQPPQPQQPNLPPSAPSDEDETVVRSACTPNVTKEALG